MRVYTFTMPKIVSGFVRKCLVVFRKEDQPKATASTKTKKKKREKTPG
ncbi:stage V sporulation protein SpoVM [Sporosarcina sp. ACRSM]|nr:stage V sporulation protein SpoVM [Sporosarcina sp. ACRSM]MCG7334094.1 stage V sporulation protein SpoVM [Sporosarcina sp. ACRSM]